MKPGWKLFAGLFIVNQLAILVILWPLDVSRVFILQTTTAAEIFFSIIDFWKQSDLLIRYRAHYFLDFIHPAIYGLFLFKLAVVKRVNSHVAGLLIIGAAALDMMENVFHLILLNKPLAGLVPLSGGASIVKWVFAAVLILQLAIKSLRGRRHEVSHS